MMRGESRFTGTPRPYTDEGEPGVSLSQSRPKLALGRLHQDRSGVSPGQILQLLGALCITKFRPGLVLDLFPHL